MTTCCHNCGKVFEYTPTPGFREEFHYCLSAECYEDILAKAAALKGRTGEQAIPIPNWPTSTRFSFSETANHQYRESYVSGVAGFTFDE